MSVYHIQKGQLTKLCESLDELIDDVEAGQQLSALGKAGWEQSEQIEGVYVLYEPRMPSSVNTALRSYAYAFVIESASSGFPWTLLVADDLGDYLEAMRLIQPLFTRSMLLEQEAYHYNQSERQERQSS